MIMNESTQKWIKGGIVITVIALLVGIFLVIFYEIKAANDQKAILDSLVEMKQLPDGTTRSSAQYVTKEDLEEFGKKHDLSLEEIKKDLASLGAQLKAINVAIVQTPGYSGHDLPSTGTHPRPPSDPNIPESPGTPCPADGICPNVDPFGYLANTQIFDLVEPFNQNLGVPFGVTSFKAWQVKPWDLTIYPREYKVSTTIGTRPDGQHIVHNKVQITTQGKTYTVPISSAELVEQVPESQFFVNPRVYLGVGTGATVYPIPGFEFVPGLSVSIFSHGTSKKIEDTDWSFLGLGIGVGVESKLPVFTLAPVSYNIGKHIPLLTNLHVGPSVGADIHGNFTVMAEVKVGL